MSTRWYRLVFPGVLLLLALSIAPMAWAQSVAFATLAQGKKANCSIVIGDKAAPEEKRAASYLQQAFLRDGGEIPPLVIAGGQDALLAERTPLIVLGTVESNPLVSTLTAGAGQGLGTLGPEGYAIVTTTYTPSAGSKAQSAILIGSKTARGVLYGATEFVGYVMQADADGTVRVANTNVRRNPQFAVRGTYNLTCWGNAPKWSRQDWDHVMDNMALNETMNRIMFWMSGLFWSKKFPNTFLKDARPHGFGDYAGTPITDEDIHQLIAHAHSLGMEFLLGAGAFAWLAGDQLGIDFPETKAHGSDGLNPSSPKAQQVMLEYLLEMYDRFPEADGFMMEIRDEYGECNCETCQRKLDEYGSKQYGQSELDLLDRLAAETWKRNPRGKVVWLIGYDVHKHDVMYYERIRQMRDPRLEWLDVRLNWDLPAAGAEKRPLAFFSPNMMTWHNYYALYLDDDSKKDYDLQMSKIGGLEWTGGDSLRTTIARAVNAGVHGYCPGYEPGYDTASYYFGQVPEPIDLLPFRITSFLYRELTWQPELSMADLESRAYREFFTPEVPKVMAGDLLWLREFMISHEPELMVHRRSLWGGSKSLADLYEKIKKGEEPRRTQLFKTFAERVRVLQGLAAGEGDMQRLRKIEDAIARFRPHASARSRQSLNVMERFIIDTHKAIEDRREDLLKAPGWLDEIPRLVK